MRLAALDALQERIRLPIGVRRGAWLGLLLLAFCAQALAIDGVDRIRFVNYGVRDGLPQTTARALLEDRQGFLWIGTQDGLARFDGYRFEVFRQSDQFGDAGLASNHVMALAEDASGAVWIGHYSAGLSRFDPRSERFEQISGAHARELGLERGQIRQIEAAPDGRVWMLVDPGTLYEFNPRWNRFTAPLPPALNGALRSIRRSTHGGLWLGSQNSLLRWDGGIDAPQVVESDAPAGAVNRIAENADGSIWFAVREKGVFRLRDAPDPPRHAEALELPSSNARLDDVFSLLVDRRQRLWLGLTDRMLVLDPEHPESIDELRADPSDPTAIAADLIASLIETRSGSIVAGTWINGISIHDPATSAFALVQHSAHRDGALPGRTVGDVAAIANGQFWAALGPADGFGLIDPDRGVIERFRHVADDPNSLPSNRISEVEVATDGSVWIGASDMGVARLSADRRQWTRFSAAGAGALPSQRLRAMHVDSHDNVWLGFADAPPMMRCPSCSEWQSIDSLTRVGDALPRDDISSIGSSRDGAVWIGFREAGLYRFDPYSGEVTAIPASPEAPQRSVNAPVTHIHEDRVGRLWLGTQGGGLHRIDPGTRLRRYALGAQDGLVSDAIGAILEDESGALWISTIHGISRFEPDSGEVRTFAGTAIGQYGGFFIGAGTRLSDGRLVFGGVGGASVFAPAAIPSPDRSVQPLFTTLSLFNKRVRPGSDAPIAQSLGFASSVRLSHEHSLVSFDFTAPQLPGVPDLRFRYRLDGHDATWIESDIGRAMATYTNLEAGNYRLRLQATTGAEPFGGPEAQLRIEVLPAPWLTTSAKLGYLGLAALFVLVLGWRIRVRNEERSSVRQAIADSEQRLKLALWGSGDELWVLQLDDNQLRRERPLPGTEIISRGSTALAEFLAQIGNDEDRREYESRLRAVRNNQAETFELTFQLRASDAGPKWLHARGRVVARDAGGRPLRLSGTHQDVTPLKRVEAMQAELQDALRHQAFHDAVTGLPNRAWLFEHLAGVLADAAEPGRSAALLVVDLDEFKLLNDSLGHEFGDRLLVEVAQRLRSLAEESEPAVAARLGGDEFGILLPKPTPNQVVGLAHRVAEACHRPFTFGAQPAQVTASIGIAFAQGDDTALEVLRNADLAMYRAKSAGKNRIAVFSPEMHIEFTERLAVVAMLRQAIAENAIAVHFQPILELQTGRWVGVEALARVTLPEWESVLPSVFIPVAEDSGLIDALGEQVIGLALREAVALAGHRDDGFFVTVNVSPRQLQHPQFADLAQQAIEASGWPAARLVLEVTESTLMETTEQSAASLARLRALGVRFALDDFGTGYSSLSQLGREHFDILKIAKPFVDGLPGSRESLHMAEAIVRMAESLGMSVIAEGVEHAAQSQVLARLNCAYAQGFLFARPLPLQQLRELPSTPWLGQPMPGA